MFFSYSSNFISMFQKSLLASVEGLSFLQAQSQQHNKQTNKQTTKQPKQQHQHQ